MVVFSNRRVGPAAEVLVSTEVACAILRAAAAAARKIAQGLWEHELARWLEDRADRAIVNIDVGDLAWSPEHFVRQRSFLVEAIETAALGSEHARAFRLWARLVEAHPRDAVMVGRRWVWTNEDLRA